MALILVRKRVMMQTLAFVFKRLGLLLVVEERMKVNKKDTELSY